MKNGKLILTKENVTVTNYDTFEKLFGGHKNLEGIIDLVKMLCEDSKRTKQIKSFTLPKKSLTVVLYYLPKVKECLIELIHLPKSDELASNVLLMLTAESPYNLHYNVLQLASNYKCNTLTYYYTIAYNKEHGKYEVEGINTEGILK